MKADLFPIDKFIQVNKLQEVTNPILIERDNIPTPDGLLSYEIFGRTVQDRSTTYAYIDLHGHFIHPLVFKVWKRVNRKIEECVSGITTFSIKQGELVPDPDGWTGLEELYNHYDEIKWKPRNSHIQNERIDMLKSLSKDEIFCSKWIIAPAFIRDIQLNKSSSGTISVHKITQLYGKILRLTTALSKDFTGLTIINNSTRNKIQSLLVECWTDDFMGEVKGKNGLFRKSVMGKSVDNGVRLVISSPLFDVRKPSEMVVDFEHAGLPLDAACACFFPFIIKWIKDYFTNNIFNIKDKFPVRRKDGTIDYCKINVDEYNDEYFTKAINSYIHSYAERFKTIPLSNDKGYNIKLRIIGQRTNPDLAQSEVDSTIMNRHATWTDLLFMAAHDVTRDKHILVTRYPLEDYFGIFPCKINITSTIKTTPMMVNGKIYDHYPIIDPNLTTDEVSSSFINTLLISNLYLKGLGGDYDGDQVTVRGVWDINANRTCEQMMYKTQNYLDISGGLKRVTEKEAIQTLYQLTSDVK